LKETVGAIGDLNLNEDSSMLRQAFLKADREITLRESLFEVEN
jgi:hypothetical protein